MTLYGLFFLFYSMEVQFVLGNLLSKLNLAPQEVPNWLVVVLGVGIVFIGIFAIVLICKILSSFFGTSTKKNEVIEQAAPIFEEKPIIENRQEIIAGVSAVIAEELGADVSAIRILSFKKL